MTKKTKDLLRGLGVISPTDEFRQQMEALTNPSYLAGIHDQLAALTNPSYLAGIHDQLAALTNPLYLTDLREQMEALTRPTYLTELREQMEALTKPTYLKEMRAQMEALTRPTYLTGLQEQMAAFTKPAYLKGMREQMEALTNPSYLAGIHDQLAALTNPLYLTDLREQMAVMANGCRMQEEFSAVLGSYQELINGSPLASFLVSPGAAGKPSACAIEAEISNGLMLGDFVTGEIVPKHSVDLEIVKALSEGEAGALSPTAFQRLQSIYLQIVVVLDMLLRIFNTCMAIAYLVALMSDASKPADVPKQAALLPSAERQLLSDYRIVNRDGARLRAEPTTASAVLVSLRLGMPVEVLDKNDKGWFFVSVEYQGEWVEGWIYLSVTTPVPAPQSPRGLIVDAGTK